MEITLFRKNAYTKEGKRFDVFVSQLTKKDGSTQYVTVKAGKAGKPFDGDKCPCNIVIDKKDAHLQRRKYLNARTGEEGYSYTLWVNNYTYSDTEYIDHSLDDYE